MKFSEVNNFIGEHVNICIDYSDSVSSTFPISQNGWLIYKKDKGFTVAFYTTYGDLDFLPVFSAAEIRNIFTLPSNGESLDIDCIPSGWEFESLTEKEDEDQITNDLSMTEKGEYQSSNFKWL